jgi:hypothetical protein
MVKEANLQPSEGHDFVLAFPCTYLKTKLNFVCYDNMPNEGGVYLSHTGIHFVTWFYNQIYGQIIWGGFGHPKYS